MKINKILLMSALFTIHTISLCSAAQEKGQSESAAGSAATAPVDQGAQAAANPHPANQEAEFSGDDFLIPDSGLSADAFQILTANYFQKKIQDEIDKLSKNPHPENIKKLIQATHDKLERSKAIKEKFVAAYVRINSDELKHFSEKDKAISIEYSFNSRLLDAKEELERKYGISSNCTIG